MSTVQAVDEVTLFGMVDPDHHTKVRKWLDRGDGVAVYENHDLGSRNIGHKQFMSYGSPAALIEQPVPPERCPDIVGRAPNWAYCLKATCKR